MKNDLKVLLEIGDRIVSEDIQRLLEESGIYSILESDNPASSVINIYSGLDANENITIRVNRNDFPEAIKVLCNSQYKDLFVSDIPE